MADAVRFTGLVDETDQAAAAGASWLHLLPSLKEGWGLVVVEAGIHGTPTVAFRSAGGTTESVVDGETGVLVDTPAEFVEAVGRLLGDPTTARLLGKAAREHAGSFTWAASVRALESVLLRAVNRAAAGERWRHLHGGEGVGHPGRLHPQVVVGLGVRRLARPTSARRAGSRSIRTSASASAARCRRPAGCLRAPPPWLVPVAVVTIGSPLASASR